MANNEATKENEKKPFDYDAEVGAGDNQMDDSKAKFINGDLETSVVIPKSPSDTSFTGLGKEELKKYAEDPFWIRLRWILFILFWVGWLAMLVAAIVIIVLAPRCPTRPDLKWYHTDIAYNVYAKSFFDGEKLDGVGDLAGIEEKSAYVKDVGANSLWLSGILKTDPGNDRAVIDHKMLDESFGNIDTLRSFCKKLMKEGRRVIMDLIPNQTSKNNTWFTKSQLKEDKYTSYYVWSKTNNGWKRDNNTNSATSDMWVYDSVRGDFYLSQFDGLPDLNLTNEDVIAEFKDIVNFWASAGVSGFHINDLEYLVENNSFPADNANQKETRNFAGNLEVVAALRNIVDGLDNKPGREKLLFGTVSYATYDQVKMYYGGEGMGGLHIVSVMFNRVSDTPALKKDLETYVNISETNWIGWRLTSARPLSHRVFNIVGDERMVTMQVLQSLLPGSSMPYYGDEIAIEDGFEVDKRTVTPMQWTKEKFAGFTTGVRPWLAVNTNYETKNLDSMTAQLGNNVLMDSFKALNKLRLAESLQFGKTMLCPEDDLFIFARNAPGFESFVVVLNLGEATAHKFTGDTCVKDRTSAQLVYHSHDKHQSTPVQLDKAIRIGKNEVLVLKFPA